MALVPSRGHCICRRPRPIPVHPTSGSRCRSVPEQEGTGFQLKGQDCHTKVDTPVASSQAINDPRLVSDHIPALRKTLFVSHSVVEDEQGRRVDPTPRRFYNEYPSLRTTIRSTASGTIIGTSGQ